MIKKYALPTLLLTCIVILIAACSGFSSGKTLNTNPGSDDDIVSGGKYSTSGDNAAAHTGEPSQSCLYWIRPK